MPTEEAINCMILSCAKDVGAVTARRLIERFGSAKEALVASQRELESVDRIGAQTASNIVFAARNTDVDKMLKRLENFGAKYVCYADAEYPRRLLNLPDKPLGLYIKGNVDLNGKCISIVGSRRCSLYGESVARKFAGALAAEGYCIISGMARGIDSAAHIGALDALGKTVAVFGCGLDIVYPPENASLYSRISEFGALVSEFPFGKRADKSTFPVRNRIIAGLGTATLVAESDSRGGSMITARLAAEYGRDVFAIPGRIDMPSSQGCHDLIRDGATLVTRVSDITESLDYSRRTYLAIQDEIPLGENAGKPEIKSEVGRGKGGFSEREIFAEKPAAKNLPPDEKLVYDIIKDGGTPLAEELAQSLGMKPQKLNAALTMLEIKRLVKRRVDSRYEKLLD